MTVWNRAVSKKLLALLTWAALVVAISSAGSPLASAQQASAPAQDRPASQRPIAFPNPTDAAQQLALGELPDSPGATLARGRAQSEASPQDQSTPQSDSQPNAAQQNAAQPNPSAVAQSSSSSQSQSAPQRPVGTAAAEAPNAGGVAASQPAGVAIAPAKQHRTRTIVIRVGVILGAGAALGTVAALSEGTSSKPPGAH
jgi:hypothetical protein